MLPNDSCEILFPPACPPGTISLEVYLILDLGIGNPLAKLAYNLERAGEGLPDSRLGALEFLFRES